MSNILCESSNFSNFYWKPFFFFLLKEILALSSSRVSLAKKRDRKKERKKGKKEREREWERKKEGKEQDLY